MTIHTNDTSCWYTNTLQGNNKNLDFFHQWYHPNDIRSKTLQQLWQTHIVAPPYE